MISYYRSASLVLLLLGLALMAQPADAQRGRRVTKKPGELIAAFVREYQAPSGPTSGVGADIAHVLTYPEDYPAADLEVFLRGLEQLALTGETSRVRASAALSLSLPGSRRKPHPIAGTTGRLERIYAASKDPAVRGVVVAAMADVAEQAKALAFLERVAIQDPEKSDFPGSASQALGALVAMDEQGRVVLKRLHEKNAVRDPNARLELAELARRGYRIR